MRILVTPTSFRTAENRQARQVLEAFADEIIYNDLGRPLTEDEVVERCAGVDGYIAGLDTINAYAIERMPPSLRVISRYGSGVDCVDLAAAKRKGITVTNTPGTNSVAVAELAIGLMLCVARKIPSLNDAIKNGGWPRSTGTELYGKTLGVVGLGAIGKKVAVRARAFDMTVIAYDPCVTDEAFARQNSIVLSSWDDLIREADFLSLHVPLTEQTKHLINSDVLKRMKKNAVIINTARGGLIDEQAVLEALHDGTLGGLGLDAFEKEPPGELLLFQFDNVVVSPHTGAHTQESIQNMGMMTVNNLIAVLSGENVIKSF